MVSILNNNKYTPFNTYKWYTVQTQLELMLTNALHQLKVILQVSKDKTKVNVKYTKRKITNDNNSK